MRKLTKLEVKLYEGIKVMEANEPSNTHARDTWNEYLDGDISLETLQEIVERELHIIETGEEPC